MRARPWLHLLSLTIRYVHCTTLPSGTGTAAGGGAYPPSRPAHYSGLTSQARYPYVPPEQSALQQELEEDERFQAALDSSMAGKCGARLIPEGSAALCLMLCCDSLRSGLSFRGAGGQ